MRLTVEQHRHRCEVRQVLRWRAEHGLRWVEQWIARVEQSRGFECAYQLRFDAAEQWNMGNRGALGDWRYAPRTAPDSP